MMAAESRAHGVPLNVLLEGLMPADSLPALDGHGSVK